MPPQWILCLRHGEKPVDDDGDELDGLSAAGAKRAALLTEALGPGGSLLPDGAGAPSAIFVPDYDDGPDRHRSAMTVAPLARRLGVQPTAVEKDDVGQLAQRILAASDEVVVVCWEHDALVAWLHRLAGMVSVTRAGGWLPVEWKKDRYDRLWRLELTPAGGDVAYTFTSIDQDLPVDER